MGRHVVGWLLSCSVFLAAGLAGCTERAGTGDHPDASLLFDANLALDARPDAPLGCHVDADCGDRLSCTIDHCTDGVCQHVPCIDCCSGGRVCDPLIGCAAPSQPCAQDADCMDAQPCTLDACRNHVCEHRPTDALCPSGQICIGAIGCTPRPPDHCATAADCSSIGFCYGTWSCETEFGCVFVDATNCDDTMACTTDRCDGATQACVHEGRDADADHHVDATCSGGDDCNDTSMTVHPGATEACNGVDDDCDTHVDEGCCAAGPCTTSCGTQGMTSCNPDGTVGACMPPIEICNGTDDDCDTRLDETFDCVRGAASPCTTSCSSMGSSVCDTTCHAGACVPPAETCNGMDDDCTGGPDNGLGCVLGASMACGTTCGSTGSRSCIATGGSCGYDACVPPAETCNGVDDNCNGSRDEGLGACYAGEMRNCSALGFISGSATCRSDCSGFDTSTCSNCGNGVRAGTEQCDMGDLGGNTCLTAPGGFNGGTLQCFPSCTYNTTSCTRCGDMVRNGPEQCDGADLASATCATRGFTGGGTLGCSATCTYNTSACIWSPTGTWVVTPGVNYYCAFGSVSLSFGNLTFTDTGTALSVSGGGINCTMTGASARTSHMIDVSCGLTGGCNEAYHLVGTFSTDLSTWTGTFTAGFTGSGCAGCTTHTYMNITGSRP